MAKRWRCARCGGENAESSISCQQCGMIRGAVATTPAGQVAPPVPPAPSPSFGSGAVPPPPPGTFGSPGAAGPGSAPPVAARNPTATAPRRRMRLPIGLIVLVVLIAGGGIYGFIVNAGRSSSGDINKAGELQVGDLRVGDCFDLADPTASSVDKTTAKPCTESHQYEVFYANKLPDGAYPTDAAVKAFVKANCVPEFGAYVGMAYENSKLEILWFSPIQEGWNQGDRGIQCTVHDPHDGQLKVSLKGSNR